MISLWTWQVLTSSMSLFSVSRINGRTVTTSCNHIRLKQCLNSNKHLHDCALGVMWCDLWPWTLSSTSLPSQSPPTDLWVVSRCCVKASSNNRALLILYDIIILYWKRFNRPPFKILAKIMLLKKSWTFLRLNDFEESWFERFTQDTLHENVERLHFGMSFQTEKIWHC